MPVVVTGAAGFIGGMLISALAADGERVVAIDRQPLPVCHPGVTVLHADLLDRDPAACDALAEADLVFHLAGWSGRRETDARPAARWYRDNVLATRVVLAAVPSRTPVVVTSSAAVYGRAGRPSREDDPVRPLGGYGRSKVEVERLCAQRFVTGGTVSVARPFTVVGEGQRPDMAIAGWIEAVRTGAPVRLVGSPWHTRDIVDVRDVIRSLRAMATHGVVGLLNIGSGAPRTLADMVAAVCRAVGAPPELVILPDRPDEPDATHADTNRHEQLLGFRPLTDLDTLVRRQLAAGLVNERLAIAWEASVRMAGSAGSAGSDPSDAPDRAAAIPVRVEPVFLETVLVEGEQDRALLERAILGSPTDDLAEDLDDDLDGDLDHDLTDDVNGAAADGMDDDMDGDLAEDLTDDTIDDHADGRTGGTAGERAGDRDHDDRRGGPDGGRNHGVGGSDATPRCEPSATAYALP